ncbi:2-oxoacid:acceptor oxidoreductase subunit alpha [Methanogenium marinum]|uniref:2-oxoacid:acceptor oxidoreductase subunit alpha n=1 Tax=Methanogenium marinum TaxID=348610 RepID=A0A9Q4PW78_9EURY|nr:2-oxoacid:acceptor oxidoreductase subunit alpha [Methanogenium marinum]MDE4907076.1 2-oxoacid:acceptor oxidoreductase subunit alpha [Methanogenium marinum]
MDECSVLIGGKAGDGINVAGQTIARIFTTLGYYVYMYYDYPSLIRGGHNFSVIRASNHPIGTHRSGIDILLAMDLTTLRRHQNDCKRDALIIYNSDSVQSDVGSGIPLKRIVEKNGGSAVMENTVMIGALAFALGMEWEEFASVISHEMHKFTEKNLEIARDAFQMQEEKREVKRIHQSPGIILSGNEAVSLGLLSAGLNGYIAYPMSPSTGILHFMAAASGETGVQVFQPESEIAVVTMAEGMVYAGAKTAVGTSGGGFCLMTEALSMAGMAEIPITIVLAQRSGPSTGTPTYTAQSDLHFAIHAGHGEFPRFVFAPGDAQQAFEWAGHALSLSWQFQVPSILMTDRVLSEGVYTVDPEFLPAITPVSVPLWEGHDEYLRYRDTEDGISLYASPPLSGSVIKGNSKSHDERGISVDDGMQIASMTRKQMKKIPLMKEAVSRLNPVHVSGNHDSDMCLISWGSNAPLCREAANFVGIKSVQPIVMHPFPETEMLAATSRSRMTFLLEDNFSGQLADICEAHGIPVDIRLPRFDGRPFTLDQLIEDLWGLAE